MGRRRTDKSLTDYKPDGDKSPPQRVADYLYWASEEYPKRSIAIELLVRVAYNLPTVPRSGNQQIEVFRKSNVMTRVRKIIREQYGCEIDYTRGVGYRATTDGNDIMNVIVEKRTRGVKNAHARLNDTLNNIKKREVTGSNKARLAELVDLNKRLAASAIQNKLSPDNPE